MSISTDPLKQISFNLSNKYSTDFAFFQSKSINQIIYEVSGSLINISFMDCAIFAQDQERLRRSYRNITSFGRMQIKDRLTVLAEFYEKAFVMKYEYPNLVINEKYRTVYNRRLRRIRKTIAADASSDYDDDELYGKYDNTFSSMFLNSMSDEQNRDNGMKYLTLSDLMNSENEYDQQVYCIYNKHQKLQHQNQPENKSLNQQIAQQKSLQPYQFDSTSILLQIKQLNVLNTQNHQLQYSQSSEYSILSQQKQQKQKLSLKNLQETNLSHLLYDFDDMDQEHITDQFNALQIKLNNNNTLEKNYHNNQLTKNRKQIQKSKDKNKSNTDNNLGKFLRKGVNSNNGVNYWTNRLNISPPVKKERILSRTNNNQQQQNNIYQLQQLQNYSIQQRCDGVPHSNHKIQVSPYSHIYDKQSERQYKQNLLKERALKKEKKQKVRDKANALLKKVKDMDSQFHAKYCHNITTDTHPHSQTVNDNNIDKNKEQLVINGINNKRD